MICLRTIQSSNRIATLLNASKDPKIEIAADSLSLKYKVARNKLLRIDKEYIFSRELDSANSLKNEETSILCTLKRIIRKSQS